MSSMPHIGVVSKRYGKPCGQSCPGQIPVTSLSLSLKESTNDNAQNDTIMRLLVQLVRFDVHDVIWKLPAFTSFPKSPLLFQLVFTALRVYRLSDTGSDIIGEATGLQKFPNLGTTRAHGLPATSSTSYNMMVQRNVNFAQGSMYSGVAQLHTSTALAHFPRQAHESTGCLSVHWYWEGSLRVSERRVRTVRSILFARTYLL